MKRMDGVSRIPGPLSACVLNAWQARGLRDRARELAAPRDVLLDGEALRFVKEEGVCTLVLGIVSMGEARTAGRTLCGQVYAAPVACVEVRLSCVDELVVEGDQAIGVYTVRRVAMREEALVVESNERMVVTLRVGGDRLHCECFCRGYWGGCAIITVGRRSEKLQLNRLEPPGFRGGLDP